MNVVLLIGRLTQDVEIKEYANGTYAKINLAVRREFKNSDGQYDTDFLTITLWDASAAICKELCSKGSLVSVKCRLQKNRWEDSEGNVNNTVEIIGEKISLLSSPREI